MNSEISKKTDFPMKNEEFPKDKEKSEGNPELFSQNLLKLEENRVFLENLRKSLEKDHSEKNSSFFEKKEKIKKTSNFIKNIEFSLEILDFELKEKQLQENLTMKYEEIAEKVNISKDLAQNLMKRAEVLREIGFYEEDLLRKSEISQEIDEINENSNEILRFSEKFKEKEGFFNGFEAGRNIEVEILELKREIMENNLKKQRLGEEIETLSINLREIEGKIAEINLKIKENEEKILEIKEKQEFNEFNEENQEFIKENKEESIENYYENEEFKIKDLKSRSFKLNSQKKALEEDLQLKILASKAKNEDLNEFRLNFMNLLKNCQEKEETKRFLMSDHEVLYKEQMNLQWISNKIKEELEFLLSKIDF